MNDSDVGASGSFYFPASDRAPESKLGIFIVCAPFQLSRADSGGGGFGRGSSLSHQPTSLCEASFPLWPSTALSVDFGSFD
jgi:hypothetical protein